MKRHCIIDIPDVKSKKEFMKELKIMVKSYTYINKKAKDFYIMINETVKDL